MWRKRSRIDHHLFLCLTKVSLYPTKLRIKHNGVTPGYLYVVSDDIGPGRCVSPIPTRQMPITGSG